MNKIISFSIFVLAATFTSIPFALSQVVNPPKIGVILPLTGPYASFGTQIKDGILFTAHKEIELIFEDSQFDIKTALSAYRKLTSIDKVDFLISAGGETCGVLNREAQRDRIVHIAVGCNTEAFTNHNSFNFRLDVNEEISAQKLASYLKKLSIQRVAIINIENTWGATVAKVALSAFEKEEIKIVDHLKFLPPEAGNLRSQLLKLSLKKPERLFIVASPETFSLVLKQLAEIRISTPIVSTISVENKQFVELSGLKSNGIIYVSVKNSALSKLQHVKFYSHFPAENTFTAWGYDALLMLKAANQNINPQFFLQNLRDFVGAFNIYNYDQRGELNFDYEVRIIRDGKYRFFADLSN